MFSIGAFHALFTDPLDPVEPQPAIVTICLQSNCCAFENDPCKTMKLLLVRVSHPIKEGGLLDGLRA